MASKALRLLGREMRHEISPSFQESQPASALPTNHSSRRSLQPHRLRLVSSGVSRNARLTSPLASWVSLARGPWPPAPSGSLWLRRNWAQYLTENLSRGKIMQEDPCGSGLRNVSLLSYGPCSQQPHKAGLASRASWPIRHLRTADSDPNVHRRPCCPP